MSATQPRIGGPGLTGPFRRRRVAANLVPVTRTPEQTFRRHLAGHPDRHDVQTGVLPGLIDAPAAAR